MWQCLCSAWQKNDSAATIIIQNERENLNKNRWDLQSVHLPGYAAFQQPAVKLYGPADSHPYLIADWWSEVSITLFTLSHVVQHSQTFLVQMEPPSGASGSSTTFNMPMNKHSVVNLCSKAIWRCFCGRWIKNSSQTQVFIWCLFDCWSGLPILWK